MNWAKSNYDSGYLWLIPNCTVFASGVLANGGIPITDQWQPLTKDFNDQASRKLYFFMGQIGPTKRWGSADYLKNYIVNEAHLGTITEIGLTSTAGEAQLGDLILYDEHGQNGAVGPDGIVDHVAIVTGFANGAALVTQKQESYRDKPWNVQGSDSRPLSEATPGTRAYLIHITY